MDLQISKKSLYFNDEEFTLIKGDSFSILKKIASKSIDMIFADPPYFLSSGGISCSGENKCQWIKETGTSLWIL